MLALIDASSAYIDAEQFGAHVGLTSCRVLLERPGLRSTTRGTILSQLGLLHMRAGERERALAAYSEAIPLLDSDPEVLARAHLNRSNVHLYMHDPRAAIADLTVAMQKFEEVDNLED